MDIVFDWEREWGGNVDYFGDGFDWIFECCFVIFGFWDIGYNGKWKFVGIFKEFLKIGFRFFGLDVFVYMVVFIKEFFDNVIGNEVIGVGY